MAKAADANSKAVRLLLVGLDAVGWTTLVASSSSFMECLVVVVVVAMDDGVVVRNSQVPPSPPAMVAIQHPNALHREMPHKTWSGKGLPARPTDKPTTKLSVEEADANSKAWK